MEIKEIEPSRLLGQLNEVEKKFAPSVLYYNGNLDILKGMSAVSIVGSRKASQAGIQRTNKLVKKLVERNIAIVSGLAEGIDTAAHTACLQLGGKTIGVIGTPLDTYYPKQNKALQDEISINHLLLSQFKIGTAVKPQNFPMRNRTMALISNATVIIEAKDKSGSLHQGWEALRLGRPLFITKSSVDDSSLSWTKEMLHYGAEILTEDTLDFLFDVVPEIGQDERDLAFL